MTTAEKRDIIGEHVTPNDIAQLAKKYTGTVDADAIEAVDRIVRELARDSIWTKLDHNSYQCVICDQIVRPDPNKRYGRAPASATNFGRTSHGAKHVRDGTALSKWGGADGVYVMPSRALVATEIERRTRQRKIDKELPKLRERLTLYVGQKRVETRERAKLEARLVDLVRSKGPGSLGLTEVREITFEISDKSRKIERLARECSVICEEFPKDVVGQLTAADL